MNTMSPWAHITYASFRNASGQGGWRTGVSLNASEAELQLVAEHAPTSLLPVKSFDDFIGSRAIEALPRRFTYQPLPQGALIMQSVPAGTDATGRPGNVFTHAVIDRDPATPLRAQYPITFFRSPDLLTPFRAAEVNTVTLKPGLAEPTPGSKSDLYASWMLIKDLYGDLSGALHQLQDTLQQGGEQAVLLLEDTDQAAFWLLALSSTLTPREARRLLSFSTFERAATLPTREPHNGLLPVLVAPREDRNQLATRRGLRVIDPLDPATFAGEPTGSWARLTAGVLNSGLSGEDLPRELIAAEDTSATEPHLGEGMARLVLNRAGKMARELVALAEQQLQSMAAATGGAGRPQPHQRSTRQLPDPRADVARVEQVIADPRLAEPARRTPGETWPEFDPGKLPLMTKQVLSEKAMDSLELLYEEPLSTLIHYLDFLLHTRLLAERVNGPEFRARFRHFPAMAEWRSDLDLPANRHGHLRHQLDLANQEYRQQAPASATSAAHLRDLAEPRAGEDPGERKSSPTGAGKWLELFALTTPLTTMITALQAEAAPVELQRLLDEEVLENSSEDYSDELLRVYYSVVLSTKVRRVLHGDASEEEKLADQLTELAKRAVRQRARGAVDLLGDPSQDALKDLGRTIARRDFRDLPSNSPEMAQLIPLIWSHTSQGYLATDRDTNVVFALVAQALHAELQDRTRPRGNPPPGSTRRARIPAVGDSRSTGAQAVEPESTTQGRRFFMKNKNKEKN